MPVLKRVLRLPRHRRCTRAERRPPTVPENFTNHGGALDFFLSNGHIDGLFPGKHYTREKFTCQLSDHLLIWLQMKTHIDGFPLEQIVQGGKG